MGGSISAWLIAVWLVGWVFGVVGSAEMSTNAHVSIKSSQYLRPAARVCVRLFYACPSPWTYHRC